MVPPRLSCRSATGVPLVCEMVRPRALSFAMQRKLVILREVQKLPWETIRKKVKNLQGKRPGMRTVRRYCLRLPV